MLDRTLLQLPIRVTLSRLYPLHLFLEVHHRRIAVLRACRGKFLPRAKFLQTRTAAGRQRNPALLLLLQVVKRLALRSTRVRVTSLLRLRNGVNLSSPKFIRPRDNVVPLFLHVLQIIFLQHHLPKHRTTRKRASHKQAFTRCTLHL